MSLRILQVSDTHLGSDAGFEISPGIKPWERTTALLAAIDRWMARDSIEIDVIIHTGDIVHRGHIPQDDGESTRRGIELFRDLSKPMHWVVGNHDNRSALQNALGSMPGESLTIREDRWAYHFVQGKERVVVLDARGPHQYDPQGEISPDQLVCLESLLRSTSESVSLFLHYPPLSLGSTWIDRTMLVRNGADLHCLLAAHRTRVRGVFFGHVHRSTCSMKDGILYAACGSATMHFPNWPGSNTAVTCDDPIAFVQYIQISDEGVVVKPQWQLLCKPGVLS